MNLSKALALTLLAALGLTGAVAGHGGTPLDHLVERAAAGDPPAAPAGGGIVSLGGARPAAPAVAAARDAVPGKEPRSMTSESS